MNTHNKYQRQQSKWLPLTKATSPTISNHYFTSTNFFESSDSQAPRLSDTALAITPQSFTTASQQQTWLPPPTSAGQPPQPAFTDFSLFSAPPPTPTQASRPRTASLASTQPRSSNLTGHSAFAFRQTAVNYPTQSYHDQRKNQKSTRPPVPLFHSNSTGNIPALQQNIDLSDINMVPAARL